MARRDPSTPPLAALLALPFLAGAAFQAAGLDRTGPGRDVVLVLIDTLRADRLGFQRPGRASVTPVLDRLADRGAWFSDAWSTAPWTPPSAMSLLTSLPPAAHGLDLPGDRWTSGAVAPAPGALTLAEALQGLGYRTLGVTAGGGVSADLGFARGFDRYYEPRPVPPEDVAAGVDRALAWLREPADTPTFLFFHTYEVHLPNTHGRPRQGATAAELAVEAYDSDLAAADRELSRLFEALERRRASRDAIVVVTSDHGENLHDRVLGGRPVEHGHHLFPELLRVPLILVAPGLIPPGGPIPGPVQSIDVMPTILSLLGAPTAGLGLVGRDLRPLLQGRALPDLSRELHFSAPLQGPSWRALRTRAWTLLESPPVPGAHWWNRVELPSRSLYDRIADPGEWIDLAALEPARVHDLEQRSARRAARDAARLAESRGSGAAPTPFGDASDSLRALGYLDAGSADTTPPTAAADDDER